ncbi:unnamed protein product [Effrenium voratum]|uniref:SF-assemblin n=1 Tax=Effrenium voratum TaxID=2562239 RepID=A0AA36NKZ0_9DINO|nr:unnamed protein product [Effrenium voratum]CAJ1442602.1 unnamed protein product [Effrenium voratum]
MEESMSLNDTAPAMMQAKISSLREKFSSFQSQWEEDTRSRIDRDSSKLAGVKEGMMKVVQSVQSEIREREEANKALGTMFESQVQAIEDRLEAVFMEKLDRLGSSVATLGERMAQVEHDFADTREKQMQEAVLRNQRLAQEVANSVSAQEKETAERKVREDSLAKQLSDYEVQTRAALKAQAQLREQKYQALRAQLDSLKQQRETGDDEINSYAADKVVGIKAMLAAEARARAQADDDIMQALKHYTTCLQDALRIINQH